MTAAPPPPLWSKTDTGLLVRLPIGLALAWGTSEATWHRLATALVRRRRDDENRRRFRQRLAAILGERVAREEIEQLAQAAPATRIVRQLQILRCYHSKGWHPDLALEGREHLDAALGEGRGAILWVVPLAYASLVTKATLHRHGVPLAHLSRWYHGVSRSRWGVALFNSIQRRAEDRFLHERVTIGDGQSPLPALRRLRQHLAENRAVSITLGHEASDTVSVPFLDGALAVPVGPMKLATSTGAKLLPVHTFARGAGAFLTRIEPPLPTALAARVPFADVARELAARLERCALEAPGEFFWPGGLVIAAPSTDLPPVPVPA